MNVGKEVDPVKDTELRPCSPVFIVGCPRSGTHLLRNMLRNQPNLSFPGESHFIPGFYKAFGDPGTSMEATKLASTILNLQWIKPWNLSLDPESFADDRSYTQVVRRIFEAWAQKENKSRWGDKTPQYVTEMPLLSELFPDCKFIHIIRDGRDVALSWLPLRFGPTNTFMAASQWKYFVGTGHRVGQSLPAGRYLEIRYEELIIRPESVMRNICSFIDESFAEKMLKPDPLILDYPPRDPIFGSPKPSYSYALRTAIVHKNTGKWKSAMADSDQSIFESVAGSLLKSLGYESTIETRRISKWEQMFWRLHHVFLWSLKSLNNKNRTKWMKTDWLLKWANNIPRN